MKLETWNSKFSSYYFLVFINITALFEILNTLAEVHYFIYLIRSCYIQFSTLFCIYTYYGKIKPGLLLEKYSYTWQYIIPNRVLIEKIESVLKRILWKAHFFLNQVKKQANNIKTTYGFKLRLHPQQPPDLRKSFSIL